jgi:hypothetical protein
LNKGGDIDGNTSRSSGNDFRIGNRINHLVAKEKTTNANQPSNRQDVRAMQYRQSGGQANTDWMESNIMVAGDILRTGVTKPVFGVGKGATWLGESILGQTP